MIKYVSLVSGLASAALQYLQPLGLTWIGHDKWASDNLTIASYIGAPIGVLLFLIGGHLPKWLHILLTIVLVAGLLGGFGISAYWSTFVDTVPQFADQTFYRDVVWKFAHFTMLVSLTVFLFCLSFFDRS